MLSVPSLLDCWHVRDLGYFRRVLKGNPTERSSQKARSPASLGTCAGGLAPGPCAPAEVNRRDAFGRTVLHHLASSFAPEAGEYLALLLTHPSLNVNLQDHESGYTALHRALYNGNLRVALMLLRRSDTDVHVRDNEGLTPFDLYNLTVEGTSPTPADAAQGCELFVWGTNRNYTLGLGHCDDCTLPERVKLRRDTSSHVPGARFDRPRVQDVAFSRWHTVVLTAERRANVYVCGIGALGRLGRAPATQPTLERLRDFSEKAVAVATGPDHTLLVTSDGAVYSFGSNRMAQLGYTVEEGLGTTASSSGTARSAANATPRHGVSIGAQGTELDLQITPRRVLGPLKREAVYGAAASRLHSVVYTADGVYTWGTNTGQLGYDHNAAPVQVQPRRITTLTQPVQQVAASEFATACLLASHDVAVFHGDAHFRIAFPVPRAVSDSSVFRPRQAHPRPAITKLTCAGSTFAALSQAGDLFTFALEHPAHRGAKPTAPRPQLVWSVRRKFSAVRDAAIGPEGALILCTASGHVHVRSPRADASKARAAKFQRVPYVQRVVRVATNDLGSFAALQAPPQLKELAPHTRSIDRELLALLPHAAPVVRTSAPSTAAEEEEEEDVLPRCVDQARLLFEHAAAWRDRLPHVPHDAERPPCLPEWCAASGCDVVLITTDDVCVPLHATLLAARVPVLFEALRGQSIASVTLVQAHGMAYLRLALSLVAALFFLHYVYTDDIPPVWTASLGVLLAPTERALGVSAAHVLAELRTLAATLQLDALHRVLHAHAPRTPDPTLPAALEALFASIVAPSARIAPATDALLHLADRDVACHTLFLRRSPMLYALLEWHRTRGDRGLAHVDMRHQRWAVVRIGLQFLYTDADADMFQGSDDGSPDAFLDLVLDVLQFADELLLAGLQNVCLALLRRRIKPSNVGALLADANRHNAPTFSEVCMDYITRNLETLLESACLDGLAPTDLARLETYIQQRQDAYLARTVASDRLLALSFKHQAYVEELDLPPPSLNLVCLNVPRRAKSPARAAPRKPAQKTRGASEAYDARDTDDSLLFAMDDVQTPAWHTVGKPRSRRTDPSEARLRAPSMSPSVSLTHASPSMSPALRASPNVSPAPRASPSTPLLSRTPSVDPRSPNASHDTWSTSSVSVETQEALARFPLAARVSQKERKKQRPTPEPVPRAAPVWGRAPPRASPHGAAAPAPSTRPGTSPQGMPPPMALPSPPTLSFAQIQQQQRAEGLEQVAQQTPTSFAQILHEEHLATERRRQEQQDAEAFERWFEQESQRVQQQQREQQRREERQRNPRRPRRGRGRGRGKAADPATARIDDA